MGSGKLRSPPLTVDDNNIERRPRDYLLYEWRARGTVRSVQMTKKKTFASTDRWRAATHFPLSKPDNKNGARVGVTSEWFPDWSQGCRFLVFFAGAVGESADCGHGRRGYKDRAAGR